jgi:ABC-type uncharacterized transport system permease subunit
MRFNVASSCAIIPAGCRKARDMNSIVFSVLAIVLYIMSAALQTVRLARGGTAAASKVGVLALGLTAVALHGALVYQNIISQRGINLGFFNAASLMGWLVALLVLLAAVRKPIENLAIALLPLAAITLILDRVFSARHVIRGTGSWQLDAHILISIIAYSLFTIAMVQAVLLAIQDHHLRNRQPGGFIRSLPPLQTMESLLFQMIGVGFAFLTISLVTGFFFLEDIFAQHLVHKTVLSIIAWIVFGVLLWGRWRFGWRGRIAIRWTLGGFTILMLAYFGTKLVLELLLGIKT